jgi:hypothetical protein
MRPAALASASAWALGTSLLAAAQFGPGWVRYRNQCFDATGNTPATLKWDRSHGVLAILGTCLEKEPVRPGDPKITETLIVCATPAEANLLYGAEVNSEESSSHDLHVSWPEPGARDQVFSDWLFVGTLQNIPAPDIIRESSRASRSGRPQRYSCLSARIWALHSDHETRM